MSYTNPTHLAIKSGISASQVVARQRTLKLYRDFQRCIPEMINLYELELPVSVVRSKVRQEFERNRYVMDLPTVDILLHKGQAEYQELNNFWKQQSHVMKYFITEDEPQAARRLPGSFMGKFLEGRN
ncbi:NADH dehydrogenase 1 alpha subcomplex 6 [Protomyces lactucae-debilis]|uniref:NADH dehydrogenase 1 alpha subcomplex 6 n=1 Tax=Protomyces lactucae-debilis TaxID=2754530 RepID=A0A1Y2FRW5_PROLT|nr:NADH dehydrogenase 1 alpha subcomplex 6 [Protomyces lactucae-debilis]ORY86327.1 NADH dehydrogenase 1 alpha subcomplex 6 [Protomyces lactucae-debilis]